MLFGKPLRDVVRAVLVHDTDTHAGVVTQDVGPMSGGVHEAGFGRFHGAVLGDVLTGRRVLHARRLDSGVKVAQRGGRVREVVVLGHILAVGERACAQTRVKRQRGKAVGGSVLVDKVIIFRSSALMLPETGVDAFLADAVGVVAVDVAAAEAVGVEEPVVGAFTPYWFSRFCCLSLGASRSACCAVLVKQTLQVRRQYRAG